MNSLRKSLTLAALAGILGLVTPGFAQQYGQWSWSGEAGYEFIDRDNELDGELVSGFEQQRFHLGLGVDGFIVHPTIANFHLGLNGHLSAYENSDSIDSERLGGRASLSLFPRGAVPAHFFVALNQYSYDGSRADESSGLAESGSSWGARAAVRRGFFRGLKLSTTTTTLNLVGYDRTQTSNHDFLDYSGSTRAISHHYRLDRRHYEYVVSDYVIDDYSLTAGEHGTVGEEWRWNLNGIAMRRSLELGSGAVNDIDTGILRNQFARPVGDGHHFSTNLEMGYGATNDGPERWMTQVAANYLHRLPKGWQLGPRVAYMYVTRGDAKVQAPWFGFDASWTGGSEKFDLGFRSRVQYGQVAVSETGFPSATTTDVGFSAAVTAAHGSPSRLRKELMFDYTVDDVSSGDDYLDELPDLGVGMSGVGTENRMSARLHLTHHKPGFRFLSKTELSRRESSEKANLLDYEVTVATQRIMFGWAMFDISAEASVTEAKQATTQNVTTFGGGMHLTPWNFVTLTASYRNQAREVDLLPDVDSERFEVLLDLQFGLFTARGRVYEYNEVLADGAERSNTGVMVSISRRFGGLLPIVSAPERRGTIR